MSFPQIIAQVIATAQLGLDGHTLKRSSDRDAKATSELTSDRVRIAQELAAVKLSTDVIGAINQVNEIPVGPTNSFTALNVSSRLNEVMGVIGGGAGAGLGVLATLAHTDENKSTKALLQQIAESRNEAAHCVQRGFSYLSEAMMPRSTLTQLEVPTFLQRHDSRALGDFCNRLLPPPNNSSVMLTTEQVKKDLDNAVKDGSFNFFELMQMLGKLSYDEQDKPYVDKLNKHLERELQAINLIHDPAMQESVYQIALALYTESYLTNMQQKQQTKQQVQQAQIAMDVVITLACIASVVATVGSAAPFVASALKVTKVGTSLMNVATEVRKKAKLSLEAQQEAQSLVFLKANSEQTKQYLLHAQADITEFMTNIQTLIAALKTVKSDLTAKLNGVAGQARVDLQKDIHDVEIALEVFSGINANLDMALQDTQDNPQINTPLLRHNCAEKLYRELSSAIDAFYIIINPAQSKMAASAPAKTTYDSSYAKLFSDAQAAGQKNLHELASQIAILQRETSDLSLSINALKDRSAAQASPLHGHDDEAYVFSRAAIAELPSRIVSFERKQVLLEDCVLKYQQLERCLRKAIIAQQGLQSGLSKESSYRQVLLANNDAANCVSEAKLVTHAPLVAVGQSEQIKHIDHLLKTLSQYSDKLHASYQNLPGYAQPYNPTAQIGDDLTTAKITFETTFLKLHQLVYELNSLRGELSQSPKQQAVSAGRTGQADFNCISFLVDADKIIDKYPPPPSLRTSPLSLEEELSAVAAQPIVPAVKASSQRVGNANQQSNVLSEISGNATNIASRISLKIR